MTPSTLPGAGVAGKATRRPEALIPRECWAAAWAHATTTVGGIALALAVLAFIAATEPIGAWLLNVSQGAH